MGDCSSDATCRKYIDQINSFLSAIWSNTEENISQINLDDQESVDRFVNKMLSSKGKIDTIREGLIARNLELKKIQDNLDAVTKENPASQLNDALLKRTQANNEKVIQYAKLLQSADGQQKQISDTYKITLGSFLPISIPFADRFIITTIAKKNAISLMLLILIILFFVLVTLAYTVIKILRTRMTNKDLGGDTTIAKKLVGLDQKESEASSPPPSKPEGESPSAPPALPAAQPVPVPSG